MVQYTAMMTGVIRAAMRASAYWPVKNHSNMVRSLLRSFGLGNGRGEGTQLKNNNPFFQAPGYTPSFWDQRTLGLEALMLSTLSEKKFLVFSNT